jgi:hypothetical protein
MNILQTFSNKHWHAAFNPEQQTRATNAVENGRILYFPQLSFSLEKDEKKLLSPSYVDAKSKNISFDFHTQKIRGAKATPDELQALKNLLNRFSHHAKSLIHHLFPHYHGSLIQARTSLRTIEISNRKTSPRKDDRRLHVDAFPANPNHGLRILRVFSNINPEGRDRIWRTGESFENVALRFLPTVPKPFPGTARVLYKLGITKKYRTEYDHIMLHIHDKMKADDVYQKEVKQSHLSFPPNSSWIVKTDSVSHAAMSGQHLLEQTFYLPVSAMLDENRSPLRILEKIKKRPLVNVIND